MGTVYACDLLFQRSQTRWTRDLQDGKGMFLNLHLSKQGQDRLDLGDSMVTLMLNLLL